MVKYKKKIQIFSNMAKYIDGAPSGSMANANGNEWRGEEREVLPSPNDIDIPINLSIDDSASRYTNK